MKKKFIVMIVAIIIISGFYSITKAENVSDLQAQKEQIKHTLYYIGGELKPGLRSPGIVQLDLR